MILIMELTAIFLITSALIFIFLKSYSNKKRISHRLDKFLPTPSLENSHSIKEKGQPLFQHFFLSISLLFKDVQFSERTENILLEAGSKLKPEEFFALRLLSASGLGGVTLILGLSWYLVAIPIIMGFVIPKFLMQKKRKKRLHVSSLQLIDILGMMANSMRAGFSFMQAMQLVGKEVPAPLGPEFDRVVRQVALGMPMEEVFEELVKRVPNKELEVVVRAILAQRKSGGNLAELLETMEETIRGRVRILEELNTLTAQGKMSSWIITLLPVGLGLYLSLVNREYFGPMLEHPLGWAMLFICGVSIMIGWIFIQKIIRIEV
ncbi:type II secretion system F family protein [Neobacillus sp. PS2-9]|uniref:type II secretion system F family protein n=1 Tax=Neobacillus sp. PS2-9 TaxID=3070676 RepID=UPI0027E0325B|nr:type II secretion system F family protein [Neobacillus sp. PS2-9]WML59150.1 type II secretion system F family protein [Neobacillus sp. PS2-9]